MASLTGALLPRLGQELAAVGGIKSFLETAVYQISFSKNGVAEIELSRFNNAELIRYISFDFERFSLASLETFSIYIMENKESNLIGWPLLKLYYSAFFSAHAIIRSQGAGVVNFDADDLRNINNLIKIHDASQAGLLPGTYVYQIERNTSPILTLKPMAEKGGVHEAFWKYFIKYIEAAAEDATLKKQPDATQFVAGAKEVADAIKLGSRSSVWISAMRNEINYQHKYGVWYPLKKGDYIQKTLRDFGLIDSSTVRFDYSKTNEPLNAFASISRYLSCLNYEIGKYLAERSVSTKGFGGKWRRMNAALQDYLI
ncbi:hypothetical protein AB4Y96_22840 [Phyllobacterium sp. TAF24]|uniref:hypothetical protein n=1 Tax=Phyllobacterium sp. TAF24 TaxID=3233068 RepID=UPI003F9E4FB2